MVSIRRPPTYMETEPKKEPWTRGGTALKPEIDDSLGGVCVCVSVSVCVILQLIICILRYLFTCVRCHRKHV